ncbi:nuclear transport factor 2 family protein [Pelosinus sp. sgz500959]|uniref:nuclear transport factor 2 family protein n=1 Tax=Pelosinus sp. sgz500959 TaxID=3242472 RepID=UPI0036734C91
MFIELPKLISDFVQAKNNHDSDAVTAYFADNAVVYDEGEEICGPIAIKKWLDIVNEKYKVTLEAIQFVRKDNEMVLTVQVSGNFEGSPIPLDYHLTISDDKISTLSIRLAGE